MRAIALAILFSFATATLVQVQILHRHGARQPLGKHSYNTSDERPVAPLLPQGYDQLFELGTYVRSEYITSDTGIRGISKTQALTTDVAAYSSNLRRTMVSSMAFLSGLYPESKDVPTMVFANKQNDWILRGYSICPRLVERFRGFLDSESFKEKQGGGNEEFVDRLAESLGLESGLENVFNVYDEYTIIRNGGYGKAGWKMPDGALDLSEEEYERLKELADWYESSKYDFALHNIHVASGLLRFIRQRMQDKIDNTKAANPRAIIEYSAHYPTILSVWASLRARNSNGLDFPADGIPGFGAALVFELHKESSGYFVRLKWWKGDWKEGENIQAEAVGIGRGQCSEEKKEEGCRFEDLDRLLAVEDMGLGQFCKDCGATADVCHKYEPEVVGGVTSETEGQVEDRGRLAAGGVGGVVGLVVGLGVALAYMTCVARRKRRVLGGSFEDCGDGEGDVQP